MKNKSFLHRRLKALLAAQLAFVMVLAPFGTTVSAASSKARKKKPTATSNSNLPIAESVEAPSDKPVNSYPSLLIGPGDELEIYVVNFSSGNGYSTSSSAQSGTKSQLPTDYLVDSDGMILFPFLGDIQLKDLTQIQAAKLMKQKLSEFINNPQVTVLVRSSNYYNVSVLGDVARPGKFLIRGEPTIFSILSEAGGPLQDANLGGAMIIRGADNRKEEIHLDRYLLDKGFREKPPLVYPGDVLMVPKNGGISGSDLAILASIVSSAALIATQIK